MTRERLARNISNSIITILRVHPYFAIQMLKGESGVLKKLEDQMHDIVRKQVDRFVAERK